MVMNIPWLAEYDTQIKLIDEQHRILVGMINAIESADAAALNHLVLQLADYASLHFDTEEILMHQYGFPGEAAHCIEHQTFSGQVARLIEEKKAGIALDKANLFAFLQVWLLNHIARSDQELARHLLATPAFRQ